MSAAVGLTGGIASGKSTVARFFVEEGVPVVDADRVAREIVAPGSDGLRAVVDAFGEGVLAADGSLDRKKLAALVFADETARKKLEAITHPRIGVESMRRIGEALATGVPYALYEAALLVENGSYKLFPALVLVAASEDEQVRRVMARDGSTEAEARARIAAQLPLAEKRRVASYVIENEGDLDALRARTREVHRELVARFGGKAGATP